MGGEERSRWCFADLHIHSSFSRATSKDLTPLNLTIWAQLKGIGLLGTGDFTHPKWLMELRAALEDDGTGFLVPKKHIIAQASVPESCRREVRFVPTVEVSSIWRKGERVRKVHTVFLVPGLEAAERFGVALGRLGNVTSDGRPIVGLDPKTLLMIARDAHPDAFAIPAHVWTPHFSLFGANSGFDSLEECFEDLAGDVFAVETGLSSDIAMNRRWSALDRLALVSSSDAHSPTRLGREATIFENVRSFIGLVEALKSGGSKSLVSNEGMGGENKPRLVGTVEFFPEEGKYHLAGHRKCKVRVNPSEARGQNGICPVCGQRLTPGVLDRVDLLADRPEGPVPDEFPPQFRLIPLEEILCEILSAGRGARRVAETYMRVVERFGPELELLGWRDTEEIEDGYGLLVEALKRMREGKVHLEPGYDGEYGRISVFSPGEVEALRGQGLLFELYTRTKKPMLGPLPDRNFFGCDKPDGQETVPIFVLTDEQKEAVSSLEGATLVVAGPGTGKTRVLVETALAAIKAGCAPGRILVLTFSNRAADEARERLEKALGDVKGRPLVATFHSFALSELSRRAEARGKMPPKVVGREVVLKRLCEVTGDDTRALRLAESRSRYEMVGGEDAALLGRLSDWLDSEGLIDLDGIVPALVSELEADPRSREGMAARFRLVLVDEFQDIGRDQIHLLRLLRPVSSSVMVVGDPDQSIYAFRGAEPRAFDVFLRDWPNAKVIRLTQSYRLTPEVAAVASHVMRGASRTMVGGSAGAIRAMKQGGIPVRIYRAISPRDEADWIVQRIRELLGGTEMYTASVQRGYLGLDDVAVLGRTHQALESVAAALSDAGIPAELASDRPLWDTPWVSVMLSALAAAPPGADAVATALAALKQTKTEAPLRERDALMRRIDGMSAATALRHLETLREVDAFGCEPERVRLLTMHASKGLEFEAVFVVGCEDGVVPSAQADDIDEERRLLFVAVTRARSFLHLSWSSTGGRGRGTMSPFLQGLDPGVFVMETCATRISKPRQQVLL